MVPGDALGQRQAIYSALGGVLFGAGWWAFIDGFNMGMNVKGSSDGGISAAASGYSWLPPFLASLFYLCLNAMKWSELDELKVQQPVTAKKARAFLLCNLFSAMCAVVGAAFSAWRAPAPRSRALAAAPLDALSALAPPPPSRAVMVDRFLNVSNAYKWAGVSTLVSTLLIILAAFVQRFATLPPS